DDIVQGLEGIDVFRFSPYGTFIVEGTPVDDIVQGLKELTCSVFSPYGTFIVEGLQWMTSSARIGRK
ncbi:hypothetical protein TNCV_4689621, partial [Trichonephila clavipes]